MRADKAVLLGYDTCADYVLADRMAGTPEAAIQLMTDIVPAATGQSTDGGWKDAGHQRKSNAGAAAAIVIGVLLVLFLTVRDVVALFGALARAL